jgi:hypothetical protein
MSPSFWGLFFSFFQFPRCDSLQALSSTFDAVSLNTYGSIMWWLETPKNRFYFLNLPIAQFLVALRKNCDVTIFFFSEYQYPNLFIGTCYLFPSISFHRDRGKSVAHHDITPAMRIVCGLSLFFPRVYEFFFLFFS